ncbi:MAG: hypothetical protein R3355_19830 [Pseudomonas sp.]|uniref:hypothetical protein n=1 Tax=Pseudomonas sp. TaxID=306 RepID=UPI00299CE82B|nr:hypothetical protein [Pseudomonas sp.]MDX1725345.1 hypothetical protein [Pseudomonas sp.]
MAVTFSDEVMRVMGFREFAVGESVAAAFSSVTVYEARGIALATGTTHVTAGTVASVAYRLAASPGVNEGCLALLNDTFAENEEEWRAETKCQGPFVLVQVGPTAEHTCSNGLLKAEADGSTTTFDCFPAVRAELAQLEARALPAILSALTCTLNEGGKFVALRKVARATAGRTSTGLVVRDIRIELRAEAYTSYNLPLAGLMQKLEAVTSLAPTLNPKASRFFALGLGEDDQLKKFLYFFLALEVETHAAFGRIDHEAGIKKLTSTTTSQRESTVRLLRTQADQLRNLYDRFVWCAACTWTNLPEADVVQFKELKKARDDIAHGSTSEPPAGFARSAELLARKILWPAS